MAIGRIFKRHGSAPMPKRSMGSTRGDVKGSQPKLKLSDIVHVDMSFVHPLTGGPGATVRKRTSLINRTIDTQGI